MNPKTDNAVSQEYNYNDSGIDNFMSRSLDEVSWQNTLGSYYNTLGNLPIGSSPTSATPINYDQAQQGGSQNNIVQIGGSNGSGSSSGVQLDSSNQQIVVTNGGQTQVIIGNLGSA